ncbi:uncharacterized protein GGS22DRAFT_183651 [Annulohypoxylon maeteangense]|uniref:uncharacterized protein n=1 Tax=Annulohypoxylon maeteangense TaxID=1927788 RepID=UPI0020083D32|nr:uncharacterized protein GGS22DRAFT_183651 [Annulohypoxylon maeteangense]KAI0890304.1 hypothetical protein GGS22DRAFT_183651 [Annulohypoxylon maeteangense]
MLKRKPSNAYGAIALFFSLISLLLTLIVVLSGVGGHVLAEYLTINTEDLNVPSRLGTSSLLKDLSSIGGQDWIGSDTDAKSLGLAPSYSLNLLTACSEDDGSTTCETPKIGFKFDPSSDLRLEGVSTFSSAYSDELQSYGKTSTFLGAGYIVGALFTALTCLSIIASCFLPSAVIFGLLTSGLAFIFLLASSIVTATSSNKLKSTFNDALGDSGVHTETSPRMIGLGFGAAFAVVVALVLMSLQLKASRSQRQQQGSFEDKNGFPEDLVPNSGLMRRVTTWNRHKYMEVEKQKPVLHRGASPEDDRRGLIATVEDDFSHDYPSDLATGPVQKKYNRHSRNPSAAYDPFASTAYGSQVNTTYDPHKPPVFI